MTTRPANATPTRAGLDLNHVAWNTRIYTTCIYLKYTHRFLYTLFTYKVNIINESILTCSVLCLKTRIDSIAHSVAISLDYGSPESIRSNSKRHNSNHENVDRMNVNTHQVRTYPCYVYIYMNKYVYISQSELKARRTQN